MFEEAFIPRVTGGTDGTRSRNGSTPPPPVFDTDAKLDALLDGVASANRYARANHRVLWRIENFLVLALVLGGAFYYSRKGNY